MKSALIGGREELYGDAGAYMAMGRAGITRTLSPYPVCIGVPDKYSATRPWKIEKKLRAVHHRGVGVRCGHRGEPVRGAGGRHAVDLAHRADLRPRNDPPTSLMTALAILLAANPYSAASVSLQLSFGAVAGLMLFSEKLSALLMPDVPRGTLRRIIRWPVNVAASSLSVMALTVPLAAWHLDTSPSCRRLQMSCAFGRCPHASAADISPALRELSSRRPARRLRG